MKKTPEDESNNRAKIPYEFNAYRREVMTALCLTKLSGRDFRVLLFILGQTDGYHRPQDKIKPVFFVERTGLDKSNIRVTIARLRKLRMIVKNGASYTVLPPNQWDKDIFVETQMRINLDALLTEAAEAKRIESDAEIPPSAEAKCIESDAPGASNSMRPELKIDAVLGSSIENSSIENLSIENSSTKVEEGKPVDILAAQTPASNYLFEKTSRKRWKNMVQKEMFEKVEADVGEARMKEAIDWALLSGISNIKSILTAAKKGGSHAERKQGPGVRTDKEHPRQAGKFGFRPIESGPGAGGED